MNSLERGLSRVAHDLDELGRPWALVGALAVAAHAEARATLDVDVAVAVDGAADAAALVGQLRAHGYRWQRDLGVAMTSLEVPAEGHGAALRLDLLFSMAGIEADVARAAERLTIAPGLSLPVARRGHLIALKLLSAGEPGREHDWRDLRTLLAGASAADVERARTAIAKLEAIGACAPGLLAKRLAGLGAG